MDIDVSIIIVCMNKLDNLYPCLDSIKNHTSVSYEIFVVAYMFSVENLQQLKKNYPWINIIESNEIRGFSENNNLALNQAKGKYCFVLNDDTFFTTPVIDNLVQTFDKIKDATIISPDIRYPDGRYQICGRRKYDWIYWIIASFEIEKYIYRSSKFENKKGIFQTYNISGAAFMIRTNTFRELGFFDEIYFFSPEDIALSTLINKKGMNCYVNENIKLYHVASSTSSRIQEATMPAHTMGSLLFFSDNIVKRIILSIVIFIARSFKLIYALIKYTYEPRYRILIKANYNTCKIIFSNKKPKDIFLKFYNNSVS